MGAILLKIQPFDSAIPEVSEIKNPMRRNECRLDFMKFCNQYFGDQRFSRGNFENVFHEPVPSHFEYCADLQTLLLAERRKRMARAAPRGWGKTTIAILATIWAIVYSHKRCIVWYCVNESKAEERAKMVQSQLLKNSLLLGDFPEICEPLRIEGETDWVKGGKLLANGTWTLWRSIDGGNLGTLMDFMRPDFIATDDPEDVSTIRKTGANVQSITAQKRFDRIDKEIGELPEQGKGSFLMITTIRSRGCLSDQFTDPRSKAAWAGKVYRAIDFGTKEFQNSIEGKARTVHWNAFLSLCGSKNSGQEPNESELSNESVVPSCLKISEKAYREMEPNQKRAVRYFVTHERAMRNGITELDPIRIPIWEFYWKVGSDERGKEIIWSELQNDPLEDDNMKLMRFSEDDLWKCQIKEEMGSLNGYKNVLCAVVVGYDAVHFEIKSCNEDYTCKHLVCCGTRLLDTSRSKQESIGEILDGLRSEWANFTPRFIAVDVGTEAGRDRGEWSEIVARYCVQHRPWVSLQKCADWDINQQHRAAFKNFCVERESNPYGVVKWNATHYKNRLAVAYNNPDHPITFFDPGFDDVLWKYIRSQTSEQYVQEFIPDKDSSKATKETWSPLPKFRNMTEFWKTASMIECLADIMLAMRPKPKPVNKIAASIKTRR